MTSTKTSPSRGRLFKLFTDLGPFFRKQKSNELLFFFDCLEICLDSDKEPEEREFYGWWITLERSSECYSYQRFDGVYNLAGDWVEKTLSAENKALVDQSFEVFINKLETLIDSEIGLPLKVERLDLA